MKTLSRLKLFSEVEKQEVEQIGIHDNFFNLGGHSLKATTLLSRLHKEFQVEVPLPQVFQTPTIEDLVNYITAVKVPLHVSYISLTYMVK